MPTPFDYSEYILGLDTVLDIAIDTNNTIQLSSEWKTSFLGHYNPGFTGNSVVVEFRNSAVVAAGPAAYTDSDLTFTGSGPNDISFDIYSTVYENKNISMQIYSGEEGLVNITEQYQDYDYQTLFSQLIKTAPHTITEDFTGDTTSSFFGAGTLFYNSATLPRQLTFVFTNAAFTVIKYKIVNYIYTNNTPNSWTLSGSNNGTDWTEIDSQTGITWSEKFETQTFEVTSPGSYSYYKWNVTSGNNGNNIYIDDFQLLANDTDAIIITDETTGAVLGPIALKGQSGNSFGVLENSAYLVTVNTNGNHTGHTIGDKWERSRTFHDKTVQYRWQMRPANLGQPWTNIMSGEIILPNGAWASADADDSEYLRSSFIEMTSGENYVPAYIRMQVKSDTYSGETTFSYDSTDIIFRNLGYI